MTRRETSLKRNVCCGRPAGRRRLNQALYVLGARKFAVIDVPPIGCCPYPRSLHPLGACIDVLNELARGFNKGVKAAMHGLSLSFQGFRYSVGSSHAVVQSIMKHPQRLGTYVCPEQLRRFDQIADPCGSGLRESCPGLT